MLSDDVFALMVAEDVKNKATPDQKQYLRSPDQRDRWRRALYILIDNLDGQLSALGDEVTDAEKRYAPMGTAGKRLLFEATQTFDDRKHKISRFKFYVEQRLAEVDRLILLGDEDVDNDLSLANFLQKAISTHKSYLDDYGIEPTVIDEALWAALNGRWVFGDIRDGDV